MERGLSAPRGIRVKGGLVLTAQTGSCVRLCALAKGAAKRAKVRIEYFILVTG